MRCHKCKNTAVAKSTEQKPLCERHFLSYFEGKVKKTISQFKLLKKNERIAVACSGGKDSVTVLVLLHQWGYKVTALLIDEGIKNYRDRTKEELERICKTNAIPLRVVSYKEKFGSSLDGILAKRKDIRACTVCGVFRRTLLHRSSKHFDVLVTGHNLDDEAQAALMNLFKGQTSLLERMGPRSSGEHGFTSRVKPLYFCTEKEVRTYSFLRRFPLSYVECPNASGALRMEFSHALNQLESLQPGSKLHFLRNFLKNTKKLHTITTAVRHCAICGDPSSGATCKSCQFQQQLVNA